MKKIDSFKKYATELSKIDKENVAGVFIDYTNNRQFIFTKDQLINQLKRVCVEISESFDIVYDKEFKELSSDLSQILPILFVGYKEAMEKDDIVGKTCGDLLKNASNTIIASISLLRNGFRLQSGVLLRSVIEMCASVVHILTVESAHEDFTKDKIKSSYSITVANKQIPLFGKIWGILSKSQVHINSTHADWYPMDKYENKDEIPATVTLGMIAVTIMIFNIVVELAYFNNVQSLKYCKILESIKFNSFHLAKMLLKK